MTDEAEIRRLIEAGQNIAKYLTTTLPEDMRAAGYRFAFVFEAPQRPEIEVEKNS